MELLVARLLRWNQGNRQNANDRRAVVVGFTVPYVPLQSEFFAVNMWSSAQLTHTLREPKPPAGAICIPDKTIHHPHCSTQFKLLLQTASGNCDPLYMYVSVMRALETCPVAVQVSLKV